MKIKKVLDEVGWYDESYFLDGEDIDLCWKIKQKGYKIGVGSVSFYVEIVT